MTRQRKSALLILISMASATCALAQTTPTRPKEKTAPTAASSPHQRDTTSKDASEATKKSGAATPQQHEVAKSQKGKMRKDCIKKEQARDPSLSKDEVKQTCSGLTQTE